MEMLDLESLEIREAKIGDSLQITKLLNELGQFKGIELEGNQAKGFTEIEEGFYKDPPDFQGIVAQHSDEIIGLALYTIKYSTWEGPCMLLNSFMVVEKYRRKGVGRRMMKHLGSLATSLKHARIMLEVRTSNLGGTLFFEALGAQNLTKDEGWVNFAVEKEALGLIIKEDKELSEISIRPMEVKDCPKIIELIKELMEFEKMPNSLRLTAEQLQMDGFYRLHPVYYCFVAVLQGSTGDEEVIGYAIFFPTYDPLLGKRVHLEDIYVTFSQRGKGVGTALFRAVAEFVEDGSYNGFTFEVLNWNTKAIEFYNKFGATNRTEGEEGLQSLRFKREQIESLTKQFALSTVKYNF